jgi:hypothetical protein
MKRYDLLKGRKEGRDIGRAPVCPRPKWSNFDPSKWIIVSLSLFGLARNLRRLDHTVLSE